MEVAFVGEYVNAMREKGLKGGHQTQKGYPREIKCRRGFAKEAEGAVVKKTGCPLR